MLTKGEPPTVLYKFSKKYAVTMTWPDIWIAHVTLTLTQTAPGVVVICASNNRSIASLPHLPPFKSFGSTFVAKVPFLKHRGDSAKTLPPLTKEAFFLGIKTVANSRIHHEYSFKTFEEKRLKLHTLLREKWCLLQVDQKEIVLSSHNNKTQTPFPTTCPYFSTQRNCFRGIACHLCRGHTFGSFHANPVKKIELQRAHLTSWQLSVLEENPPKKHMLDMTNPFHRTRFCICSLHQFFSVLICPTFANVLGDPTSSRSLSNRPPASHASMASSRSITRSPPHTVDHQRPHRGWLRPTRPRRWVWKGTSDPSNQVIIREFF